MGQTFHLVLISLAGGLLSYGLIRLASVLFEKRGKIEFEIASPLLGYALVCGILAVIFLGFRTTILPAVLALTAYGIHNTIRHKWAGLNLRKSMYESAFVILNIGIHWLVFYDWRNACFFSEWQDSYSYAGNVIGMLENKMDCVMHECSNAALGYDSASTIYHYSEYYLTFLSVFLFGKSSYFSLFFIAIPVIMSLAQIQLVRYLRIGTGLNLIQSIALVLGITTCIRYVNIGALVPGNLNGLSHFPLFQISDYFNIFFYNFSGKIPLFLLLFFSLNFLWKEKMRLEFGLAFMLIPVLNLTFLPYFILFFGMVGLAEKRSWRWLLPAGPLLLPVLLFPLMLNAGKDLAVQVPSAPYDFDWIFHWKEMITSLKSGWMYLLGNFYALFLLTGVLFIMFRRSFISIVFFSLVCGYPFLLNRPGLSGGLFLLSFCFAIYLFFWLSARNLPVFFSIISLMALHILFAPFKHGAFRDIFQLREFPLIGFILALPFLILSDWKKGIPAFIWIPCFAMAALNLYEMHFMNNRVYYRNRSPLDFHKQYFEKTHGKKIRAAYLSESSSNILEADLISRAGYDLMNVSDSLELFYLGLDKISHHDSLLLARSVVAWGLQERQPFALFCRMNPQILSREAQRLAFMKQHRIQAFFRNASLSRSGMNYLNTALTDSLYNPSEKYWVYFLKFED